MLTKKNPFNFSFSYTDLPSIFYSITNPEKLINPELVFLNQNFINELGIINNKEQLTQILSGNTVDFKIKTFAQAYAGHQFGHFNRLGDGRAIMLGEYINNRNEIFDIQLKGAGKTIYSRGGDGKATLNAMLREYLISEAMHNLNIPTSRSLSVFKSSEPIYRNVLFERGILCRVMKSHLRVGTFQYGAFFGKENELENLLDYTIKRYFPELIGTENKALIFLEKVIQLQIDLVVNWMRVGFIHGVMNTDNTSITGETFDYGPCAFMNSFNSEKVYSSIDINGRYSFGNQPKILFWNIIKLSEALLILIDKDTNKAILLAEEVLNKFDIKWQNSYYEMMNNKIGLKGNLLKDNSLINELLSIMAKNRLDYTNTFTALYFDLMQKKDKLQVPIVLNEWKDSWKKIIQETNHSIKESLKLMLKNNPVFIPRNHLVEEAILKASTNDYQLFNELLEVYKNPYLYQDKFISFINPPSNEFEESFQTFCGT